MHHLSTDDDAYYFPNPQNLSETQIMLDFHETIVCFSYLPPLYISIQILIV